MQAQTTLGQRVDAIGALEVKVVTAAYKVLWHDPASSGVEEAVLFARAGQRFGMTGAEALAAYRRRPDIVEPLHNQPMPARPAMCVAILDTAAENME